MYKFFSLAKDCYFNKKDTIVSFRNTEKSDSQTGICRSLVKNHGDQLC